MKRSKITNIAHLTSLKIEG